MESRPKPKHFHPDGFDFQGSNKEHVRIAVEVSSVAGSLGKLFVSILIAYNLLMKGFKLFTRTFCLTHDSNDSTTTMNWNQPDVIE